MAGVDPADARAAAANLPPIDSIDAWPKLVKENKSNDGRLEILIGSDITLKDGSNSPKPVIQGIISDERLSPSRAIYKVINGFIGYDFWQGPQFPNSTSTDHHPGSDVCAAGCLFDILEDPTEHNNLNSEELKTNSDANGETYESIYQRLNKRITSAQGDVFAPDRGVKDPQACEYGVRRYNGFWGPWLT